ncbi:MAG: hypothetical protein D4Q77_00290 [Methanothrix sp.]|nr:MAG: hypothetical protein D4Q77_00290 [Methanothrix sp.]
MPHMCTRCNNVFDDGVDVLTGCPICGWKKFLFVRSKGDIIKVKERLRAPKSEEPSGAWPEKDDSLSRILKAASTKKADRGDDERLISREQRILSASEKNKQSKPRPRDLPLEKPKREDETVESIRMPEPGSYELNLATLFEREELVMSVDNGTYLIDLSSAFKKIKKD